MIQKAKRNRLQARAIAAATAQLKSTQRYMAGNLHAITEYESTFMFLNIFLNAEKWLSQNNKPFGSPYNDTSNPINVNSKEFPTSLGAATEAPYTQVASALFCDKAPSVGSYPQGQQYLLRWEGDPNADFGMQGNVTGPTDGLGHRIGTPDGANRRIFNVGTSNGQLLLHLRAFDPGNPITKIEFIPLASEASYDAGQVFNPEYLALLSKFNLLRYMDTCLINNSPVVSWGDQRDIANCFQGWQPGMAIEYAVMLCNAVGADMWYCFPHQADDTFVTNTLTYIRDNLNPKLKLYIEYSNEVWNLSFTQRAYAIAQANAAGLGHTNDGEAALLWTSRRSVQIFQIAETVFGGLSRLVRVIAGQNVGAFPVTTMLDFVTDGQPASARTDAYALAPYVGSWLGDADTWTSFTQFLTPDEVLDELDEFIADDANWANPIAAGAAAKARGCRFITYEGGQHLGGNNPGLQNDPAVNALFIGANRLPRMGDIYDKYLQRIDDVGFEWLCHYHIMGVYAVSFSWGLYENMATPTAKSTSFRKHYRAL